MLSYKPLILNANATYETDPDLSGVYFLCLTTSNTSESVN